MPAPDAAIVAYAVVFGVPLLILAWYYRMYSTLGNDVLTGGGLSESRR